MSKSETLIELQKELAMKTIDYFRMKSRREWLKKHKYILIESPSIRDLRDAYAPISTLERRIGELKAENCPAHVIESHPDYLPERKCLIHQVTYDSENIIDFFRTYCYPCPFTPEDVTAIMAANAFRKGRHEEGD